MLAGLVAVLWLLGLGSEGSQTRPSSDAPATPTIPAPAPNTATTADTSPDATPPDADATPTPNPADADTTPTPDPADADATPTPDPLVETATTRRPLQSVDDLAVLPDPSTTDGAAPDPADAGSASTGSSATTAAESDEATPEPPFSPLRGRLAYLGNDHVAVVDLASGEVARVPIGMSGSVIPLAGYELLNDRSRTVAVSLDSDPPTAVLIASSARLVASLDPSVDYWVVGRPDGPAGTIRLSGWQDYGYMTGKLEAPTGSGLIAGNNAGLFVTPPVGRTFRPTLAGFEVVSEHRLLAAGNGLRVEQRCDDRLSCAVVAVDSANGEAAAVPGEFVAELSEISVSGDGRWLLNDTSPARLLDRRTGQVRLLEVGGFGGARWSQDSMSVAWLTSDRTPTLVIARAQSSGDGPRWVDGPGWLTVELAGLGADPAPRTTFLLDLLDPEVSWL